jgi:bile acid:Na+ symporter, BASS family
VVVPLALEILERISGRALSIAAGNVARIVLVTSLLPMAFGMVVRAFMPQLADSLAKVVGVVVMILLPLATLALLVATVPAMWALVGNGTLVAMLMFLTIGLVVGHVLGGPDSVVLALSTACRHPAVALSITAANFPEQRFDAAILLYVLLSAIAGIPYLAWQRRQMALRRPA